MSALAASSSSKPAKPPYVVPTMAEVAAVPSNGLIVASLFAGGGGSCLGYKMAGFRVVWANERDPVARETYAANFPATILDGRDVREVTAAEILAAAGLREGELDVLDGSPPCSTFSMAGNREADWGKTKSHSYGEQRDDDLFFEYARLLDGLRPRAFVAENVAGLVRGTAKGYFKEILRRLEACGYRVEARLLDAQWLGIPQQRQRLIFVGARSDLDLLPRFPKPLPYRYSIRETIGLPAMRTGRRFRSGDQPSTTVSAGMCGPNSQQTFRAIDEVDDETSLARFKYGQEFRNLRPGEGSDRYFNLHRAHPERPAPCITAMGGTGAGPVHWAEPRRFRIDELKLLTSFPADFVLVGTYAEQWRRIGMSVAPFMMRAIAREVAAMLEEK